LLPTHCDDGPFAVRALTDGRLAPWRTQDCSVQSPLRAKAWGAMDIEGRRHGRGACRLMLYGCSDWVSTDRQARYVPGSVEGIREALAWAGLDYDHGDRTSVGANLDDVS